MIGRERRAGNGVKGPLSHSADEWAENKRSARVVEPSTGGGIARSSSSHRSFVRDGIVIHLHFSLIAGRAAVDYEMSRQRCTCRDPVRGRGERARHALVVSERGE